MKIAGIETALYHVPPKTVRFDSIQEFFAFEMIVARIAGPSEWMRVAHIAAEPGPFLPSGNRLA